MSKENLKQALIAILVAGAGAFFSTLFQGLADLLKENAVQAMSAVTSAGVYLAKAYKG
jgi:hypothetical protein